MDGTVGARLRVLVEEGKGESIGSARFFPLVTLDSGTRVGLDGEGRFALASAEGDVLSAYTPEDAHVFHEVLEWKRSLFDDTLEDAARALGLPAVEVGFAFPVTGIVRAVLAKNMHYTTRLALSWLRPSELRNMQNNLHRVAGDRQLPTSLRDFAQRLLVPS